MIPINIPGHTSAFSFHPDDIAGNDLWLDGLDPSTIIVAVDQVSAWMDKSSFGNNFTLSPGATNPTYNPSGYLEFAGSDQLRASSLYTMDEHTWYLAVKHNDGSSAQVVYQNDGTFRHQVSAAGGIVRGASIVNAGNGMAIQTPSIVSVTIKNSTLEISTRLNGVEVFGTTTANISGGTGLVLSGRSLSPGLNSLDGNIYSVLHWPFRQNVQQRADVERWLNISHSLNAL